MFVKSHYLNDNKYNNLLFNNLRIYFERETKVRSVTANFGNTFRNSKWSDLHKVNIKESYLKTFINASSTLMLVVFSLMYFLGKSNSEHYLGFLPFFSVLDISLSAIMGLLYEAHTQLFIFLFSLATFIKNSLPNIILNLVNNSFSVSSADNHKPLPKKLTNAYKPKSTLSKKLGANSGINERANYLLTLHKLLAVQDLTTKTENIKNQGTRSFNSREFLPYVCSQLVTTNTKTITNLLLTITSKEKLVLKSATLSEAQYTANLVGSHNKQYSLTSNLSNFQKLLNMHQSLTRLDFNLLNNLNIAKEQRWLTKNSLLTEFLSKNSNLFTQSKKLLGLSLYTTNVSAKNL